jgi:hypothetical protein
MSKTIGVLFAIVLGLFLALGSVASAGNKCSFDSDCGGYGKCSSGECGHCSFDSDCGGHGKCSNGLCGACSFDSDCKGGKCSSGRCSNVK